MRPITIFLGANSAGRHQEAMALYSQVLSLSDFVSLGKKAAALRGRGYVLIEERDLETAERTFY